jgi:hypothetical protein
VIKRGYVANAYITIGQRSNYLLAYSLLRQNAAMIAAYLILSKFTLPLKEEVIKV